MLSEKQHLSPPQMSFTKISEGSFIPWLISLFVSPSRANWLLQDDPGPDPVLQQDLGVGWGDLQNALASWESSFHTQKTYHPTLLARFQSLMTFVNHQPVCLHQRTLPTDTPFNTKAVAIPFKRGSLKAPLCSPRGKQNLFPSKLQAFRNNATKGFLLCVFWKFWAWFAQHQQKLWFCTRKAGPLQH